MDLTREQVAGRKEKAVRFVANVLDDHDRADEIEDEDLDAYADRRGFNIINPRRRRIAMATKQQLEQRIAELEDENQDLADQLDAIADIVSPEEEDDESEDTDDDEDTYQGD